MSLTSDKLMVNYFLILYLTKTTLDYTLLNFKLRILYF